MINLLKKFYEVFFNLGMLFSLNGKIVEVVGDFEGMIGGELKL